MMNKLTISTGKGLACLILLFLFLAQGCKKEILLQKDNNSIISSRIRNITYQDFINSRHVIAFKDKVEFNKINLDDIGPSTKNFNSTNLATDNGLKGRIIASISSPSGIPNLISLEPGECEIYDVYTVVPHSCSKGDWPGTCVWEVGGTPEPGGSLPYYSLDA